MTASTFSSSSIPSKTLYRSITNFSSIAVVIKQSGESGKLIGELLPDCSIELWSDVYELLYDDRMLSHASESIDVCRENTVGEWRGRKGAT